MKLALATWQEVEAYLARSKGVVVPLGSTEQHGPNGLIGTDAICATAVAEGLAERAGALVAPTIQIGVAQFNLGFPGTISARASTLMALLQDYVHSLARHGFDRIYFMNGHGGNLAPAKAAFQDLYAEYSLGRAQGALRLRIRSWWELPTVDRMRRELFGEWEGMHATPSEVAITQALLPGAVGPAAKQPPRKLSAEFLRDHAGDNHYDAATHRGAFPDGRVGSDPALASAELGSRLLAAAVEDAVADYRAFLEEK
ncbi:MAG TPA: creatininase family protein [Burkholderiales bacterium]